MQSIKLVVPFMMPITCAQRRDRDHDHGHDHDRSSIVRQRREGALLASAWLCTTQGYGAVAGAAAGPWATKGQQRQRKRAVFCASTPS